MNSDTIFPWESEPNEILLNELEIRPIQEIERKRFGELLDEEHYLGDGEQVGEMVRQVVTYQGRWVALFLWGPSSYHLAPRDEWIGWDAYMRKHRLKLIIQNRRFLVLSEARMPNLASKALSLSTKSISEHWEERFGYRPLLAETFTDPEQFHGTCYKAANWEPLGFTQGFARHRSDYYVDNKHPKKLWVKPLHRLSRYWLCSTTDLPHYSRKGVLESTADKSPPLKQKHMESLFDALRQVPDPRARNNQFRSASMLSVLAMAILCGYTQLTQVLRLAWNLNQHYRKVLGFPIKKGTQTRVMPSYSAFYNLLKQIDLEAMADVLNQWLEDNRGNLPTSLALDGKSLRGRVMSINLVDQETGAPAAMAVTTEKGKELPKAQELLDKVEAMDGCTVSSDALHTQKKRARTLKGKGAHYIHQLKDNQSQRYKQAQAMDEQGSPLLLAKPSN